jgi:4-hydroxy-2-oxoheptanedioate aldolase
MRGAHYTVSRAAHWGVRAQDYAERYERELLIIAMIESHAGLRAASEIAAVEGIDMLFFGPLDYTADIGRMGHFDDTRVSEAIDSLASAVRGSGKWLGCTVLPSFTAADLVARDYRFVTAGSDVGFLQSGARAALASAGQLPRRR